MIYNKTSLIAYLRIILITASTVKYTYHTGGDDWGKDHSLCETGKH